MELEHLGIDDDLSEQVLACLAEGGLVSPKSGAMGLCIMPIGVVFKGKKDKTLELKYLKVAQDVLKLHKVNINKLPRSIALEVGAREWIKGMTLIVAGALLCRYPPPIRTAGIWMIRLGMGLIGWEYYDAVTDYLIDNKILREKIELRD